MPFGDKLVHILLAFSPRVCIMHCMAKRVGAQPTTAQIIGQRLLDARLEGGLTQTAVAMRLVQWMPQSYSPHSSAIHRVEKPTSGDPDIYMIAALARVYHRTFNEIAPELMVDAHKMRVVLEEVVDLTGCAPWELNPQPADSRSVAVQGSFFEDDWSSGGSSEPPVVIDLRDHVMGLARLAS
jgi:transcriptional regulator with XRE-family HTH domain